MEIFSLNIIFHVFIVTFCIWQTKWHIRPQMSFSIIDNISMSVNSSNFIYVLLQLFYNPTYSASRRIAVGIYCFRKSPNLKIKIIFDSYRFYLLFFLFFVCVFQVFFGACFTILNMHAKSLKYEALLQSYRILVFIFS